jgi:hypothetical protein
MAKLRMVRTYAGADVFSVGKIYDETEIGKERAAAFLKSGDAELVENAAATPNQTTQAQALAAAKAKKDAQDAQDKTKAEAKAAAAKAKAETKGKKKDKNK